MNKLRTLLSVALLGMGLGAAAQTTPTRAQIEIANPEMRVFLPAAEVNTGRAVVCFPGGGYAVHATDHEGYDWAEFFNSRGIALIVCKYTLPGGDRSKPIGDAEAAIRMVRDSAEVWAINPQSVGVMGSSAGGHLASTVATHYSSEAVRPDFQILFYPVISMDPALGHRGSHDNLLGKDASPELDEEYSNEKHCTAQTPRAIILASDDDRDVPVISNAVPYFCGLKRAGVPAALYVYPTGRHGWGIKPTFAHHAEMLADLSAWLRTF